MSAESFVIGIGFLPNANLALLSESITVLQDNPSTIAAIEGSTQSAAAGEQQTPETQEEESKEPEPSASAAQQDGEDSEEDKLTF